MALMRWDPLKDILSLQERMNRLFDDMLVRTKKEEETFFRGMWSPAVDIYETEDEIVLKAELPGVNKDDVSVEVTDNLLILKGERRAEKEIKEENYHRRERVYGAFQRSFTLPNIVDKEKVRARYKDGVLEITLPKASEAKPKQIKVEVK